jgi:hypothetical protein
MVSGTGDRVWQAGGAVLSALSSRRMRRVIPISKHGYYCIWMILL